MSGGIKLGDPADATFARQQVLPNILSFVTDCTDQADSRDDNSAH